MQKWTQCDGKCLDGVFGCGCKLEFPSQLLWQSDTELSVGNSEPPTVYMQMDRKKPLVKVCPHTCHTHTHTQAHMYATQQGRISNIKILAWENNLCERWFSSLNQELKTVCWTCKPIKGKTIFFFFFIFSQADLSEISDPSNEMEKSKNSQSLICGRPLLWKTVCASVHAKSLSAD